MCFYDYWSYNLNMELNRHDIPETFSAMVTQCISLNVIDNADAYALAITHGTDFAAVVEWLVEAAFAGRHSEVGFQRYRAVCQLAEAFWIAREAA